MKSILVTGGAGYIGSHTAKALSRAGYLPVVLDNLCMGHRSAVKWGPLIEGDLDDRALLRQTLEQHHIDAVVHFAAHAAVGESVQNPFKYLHGNVDPALKLLEEMSAAGVRHIVFSSTCSTYGVPREMPISETHPQSPVNPYGESKLYIEHALQWYEQAHGLTSVTLRYFNAAGADPEGEIGEDHDPESHLIPLVIFAVLGHRPAIDVLGGDYPTPDGTCIRDYVHVADLADAHVQALDYLASGGASTACNLGTGAGHSVREVIASVQRVSGRTVPIRECPRRPGDPPVLVADNARAQQVFGWTPVYPSLDDIVLTAWNWHSSRQTAAAR